MERKWSVTLRGSVVTACFEFGNSLGSEKHSFGSPNPEDFKNYIRILTDEVMMRNMMKNTQETLKRYKESYEED